MHKSTFLGILIILEKQQARRNFRPFSEFEETEGHHRNEIRSCFDGTFKKVHSPGRVRKFVHERRVDLGQIRAPAVTQRDALRDINQVMRKGGGARSHHKQRPHKSDSHTQATQASLTHKTQHSLSQHHPKENKYVANTQIFKYRD